MAYPFCQCDDVHDAATDALRAIADRLSRRGLELAAESRTPLREAIAGALERAEVEG